MREVTWVAASLFLAVALTSGAEESLKSVDPNDGWTVATKSRDVTIYSRIRAGSSVKEFRAVGGIDAPSPVIRAVLDDIDSYPSFMPFTTECRLIKRESDSVVSYQRLSPKICQDRDYTLRIWEKSWAAPGGTTYSYRWSPANELGPPEKKGVVRVKTCEGGWLLEPDGAGKTRATYSVYSDTGGAIPPFIANHASQSAIGKIFIAVRKQAKDPKYNSKDEGGGRTAEKIN
ncbi:MAG: START domain-containing protein [Spartobacteria bacterium]